MWRRTTFAIRSKKHLINGKAGKKTFSPLLSPYLIPLATPYSVAQKYANSLLSKEGKVRGGEKREKKGRKGKESGGKKRMKGKKR